MSKILPIHKGDSVFEMSNYRPISLLPIFSKILEKLMYSRVIDFIKKFKILYANQYGFQKGLSTELAINSLLNNIIDCLENKEVGFCILLDFAKAFDTVNHEILLEKLYYYGIRGVAHKWFKSYLSERMQCTEIGNTRSKFDFVKSGVPQGSVLGPLLFLLYINDIVLSSNLCKFTLFADDTSLFYSHKSKKEGTNILNSELDKIADWLAANKLSLNVSKSKLLIFNNNKGTLVNDSADSVDDSFGIYINGEKLKEVDHAKYLGALIDDKLNWSYHIKSVNLKLSKGIGLLAKIRHYVPSSTLKSLYYSFLNPYIDYNLLNWGMAATTNLNSVNLKIKKAIRIISFKERDFHTDPLFKDLEILPLEKSIEFKYAKFMWRLANKLLPENLSANFRMNERNMIPNSISRLESLKRFIRFSGPELWNELPHCITNKPTLNSFSNNLKKYFIHGTVHNSINTRGNNSNSGNNGNHASRLTNNTGLNRPFASRWNQ